MTGAHNALLDLEELEYDDLERIRADYTKLAQRARDDVQRGSATPTRPISARGEAYSTSALRSLSARRPRNSPIGASVSM